jgi:hypothetical protein
MFAKAASWSAKNIDPVRLIATSIDAGSKA